MSFGVHLRNALLILLIGVLAVVLAVAISYGVLCLQFLGINNQDLDWLMLLCFVVMLASFPGIIAGGLFIIRLFTELTDEQMQGKLLLLLALGAVSFWLGLRLCIKPITVDEWPEFILALLNKIPDDQSTLGAYLMLFGGSWILATLGWSMHLTAVEAVLRYVLAFILLLVLFFCALYLFFAAPKKLLIILLGIGLGLGSVAAAIIVGYWVPDEMTYSVEGKMHHLFWFLYLFDIIPLLLGLWLILDRKSFAEVLYQLPWKMPDICYILLYDIPGFFLGIFVTFISILFIGATISIQRERCPYCGRYRHRREVDISSEYRSRITGTYDRITTKTTTEFITPHLMLKNYDRTIDHMQTVKYSGKRDVSCGYCKVYFGQESYQGSYDTAVDSEHSSWSESKLF